MRTPLPTPKRTYTTRELREKTYARFHWNASVSVDVAGYLASPAGQRFLRAMAALPMEPEPSAGLEAPRPVRPKL